MMTSAQLRMARAALGWTVRDLEGRTLVHRNTISRLEGGGSGEQRTLLTLRRSLEEAGIIFLEETAEAGAGVRLRKDRAAEGRS